MTHNHRDSEMPHDAACCHHEHQHEHHHEHHSMKLQLTKIIVAVVLLVAAVLIEHCTSLPTWQLLLVYLVPYLYIGSDTLKEAAEGIMHGEAFNEHFLMSVATMGALLIGFLPGAETEFPEAVFVMLFFQIGELFEGYAEGKSRKSIAHLMDIRPDVARVEERGERREERGERREKREERMVHPSEVPEGSVIIIRPGEKVPLDGIVIEGHTSLNTVALTGESLPRETSEGNEVISGCINLSGVIRVRTTKSFGESTVSKILKLVEHATSNKSRSEAFITKFARIYTPIVVFAAIAIAILPPLVITLANNGQTSFGANGENLWSAVNSQWSTWLYRALMFLVVSCPCALVLSIPLTFFGGIGGASRKGILIKGANYIDTLAKLETVAFDKTGTLTHGQFAVQAVHEKEERGKATDRRTEFGNERREEKEEELLHLAAHVEHHSTHPIGAALRAAFPQEATDGCIVSKVEEFAGQGIRATVEVAIKSQRTREDGNMEKKKDGNKETGKDGNKIHTVSVGNTTLMETVGAKWHPCTHAGTIIHVAIDGEYAGHIVINDKIKADSKQAIDQLRALGIHRTLMLTGDRREVAIHVAQQLGITEYHAELLPADKAEIIGSAAKQGPLAYVGDGINDAPVLARAEVGIAMGGLGSDAAIEAADVVIMDDQPSKVPLAIRIARRTIAIARQNIIFAIGIKVAVLLLAVFGLCTMWMAVFADVGVTVLAVLNAMRALKSY